MPATIPRDRVRIAADSVRAGTVIDNLTGKSPEIWRGADMQFEIGVFFNGTLATDISNIASITVELKSPTNPSGPALVAVVVPAANLTSDVTSVNWRNQTAQHCIAQFTADDTNFDLDGALSASLWLVIGVTTADAEALYFPIGVGLITVRESGFSRGDTQISLVTPPVRVAELLVQCPDNNLWYYIVPRNINGVMTPSIEPMNADEGLS
jgi:hypothetical protein